MLRFRWGKDSIEPLNAISSIMHRGEGEVRRMEVITRGAELKVAAEQSEQGAS